MLQCINIPELHEQLVDLIFLRLDILTIVTLYETILHFTIFIKII